MAVSQLNVRIPSDLKAEGDEVFSAINWSTTRAVQELWCFATRHRNDPDAVAKALLEEDPEGEDDALDERLLLAAQGRSICDSFRSRFSRQDGSSNTLPAGASTVDGQSDDADAHYRSLKAEATAERESRRELV